VRRKKKKMAKRKKNHPKKNWSKGPREVIQKGGLSRGGDAHSVPQSANEMEVEKGKKHGPQKAGGKKDIRKKNENSKGGLEQVRPNGKSQDLKQNVSKNWEEIKTPKG